MQGIVTDKEKVRAHNAITRAVSIGTLPRVSTQICVDCGASAQHYHHHLGYSEEHKSDVVPLCQPCHVKRTEEHHRSIDRLLEKQRIYRKALPGRSGGRVARTPSEKRRRRP